MTILLFLLATVGFAQGKTSEEKAAALTEKMQSEIKFSDETKTKVHAINLDFVNKASELKASDASKMERFKALKQLDDDRADQFKKIFSQTEYAAFEKFRQENREQMKERVKERRN